MYRYTLYFAPPRSSALWRAGTQWLGRDPASNETCVPPVLPGYTRAQCERLTKSARQYGFHATLKPPFRLTEGCTAAQLNEALQNFSRQQKAIVLPPLMVATLGDFIALRPTTECAALNTLGAQCACDFERFRAPLSDRERERRLSVPLTSRQRDLLDIYGYPYVLDEWRFHLTLSAALPEDQRQGLIEFLAAHFADSIQMPLTIEDIALVGQPAPQADFVLLERHTLGDKTH